MVMVKGNRKEGRREGGGEEGRKEGRKEVGREKGRKEGDLCKRYMGILCIIIASFL